MFLPKHACITNLKFKFWVVVMITKQPFYLNGLEDEEKCRESAVGALALFLVTFVSSIGFIWYDSRNRYRWDEIATEEDHDLLPRGMSAYNIRTDSEIELSTRDFITESITEPVAEPVAEPVIEHNLLDLPEIS